VRELCCTLSSYDDFLDFGACRLSVGGVVDV